ncbi:MAG: hypothetical protein Q8O76_13265 [Chloroflexota bacterium]|nr:hypothetical protein [Chloroflexota bacterium]
MFTSKFLRGWWDRALRRRVLFSTLDAEDRGYLYLSMKCFDEIHNSDAGTIIVKILAKLRDAAKSGFVRHVETFGIRRVREIREQAVSLGSLVAVGWAREIGFVRYLAFLDYNQPRGWGSGRTG